MKRLKSCFLCLYRVATSVWVYNNISDVNCFGWGHSALCVDVLDVTFKQYALHVCRTIGLLYILVNIIIRYDAYNVIQCLHTCSELTYNVQCTCKSWEHLSGGWVPAWFEEPTRPAYIGIKACVLGGWSPQKWSLQPVCCLPIVD